GRGLIKRSEDPKDRRVRQVRLTAKGRGLVARGVEARLAWTRELSRRIPPRELGGIIETLERLTQGADAPDRQEAASLPEAVRTTIAARLGITPAELAVAGQDPLRALVVSGLLILVFAAVRGLFAFSHAYMGERVSQSVAFDLRNDLFARIQRLSFSYHDRNQTGH